VKRKTCAYKNTLVLSISGTIGWSDNNISRYYQIESINEEK